MPFGPTTADSAVWSKADGAPLSVSGHVAHQGHEQHNLREVVARRLGVWERNARAIAFYERWRFEMVGDHAFHLRLESVSLAFSDAKLRNVFRFFKSPRRNGIIRRKHRKGLQIQ